ncbi:MAG: 16S rRNA (adenine(1518)-N(6)/adenine(1519)-N(6))-dimethyltransferase RsmA [Chitinophagales bacterium]
MQGEKLTRPSVVAGLLERHGIRPRKRFGQNFLIDENILGKITAAAELSPGDRVLEVGPGLGTLTAALAAQAGEVVAVEIDRDLFVILQETVGGLPNVRLIQGDILDLSVETLWPDPQAPYKLVANLPYYITTPVLFKFLLADRPWRRMVFMVQREVADRFVAAPGTKAYGALSVLVRLSAEAELVTSVPRTAFYPAPEVGSAVVALRSRAALLPPGVSRTFFFGVVRAGFAHRRKTLSNSLSGAGYPAAAVAEALEAAGIDGRRRGETLSLEEYLALAHGLAGRVLSPSGV